MKKLLKDYLLEKYQSLLVTFMESMVVLLTVGMKFYQIYI